MASESLTVLIPRSRLLELTNRVATLEAERDESAVQAVREWLRGNWKRGMDAVHDRDTNAQILDIIKMGRRRLAATQEGSATDV